MRVAVDSKIDDLGFTLKPRRSRRIKSTKVSDLCFADDIALISDEIWQAQEQLKNVEVEAIKVGLNVNGKKTELMAFNQEYLIPVKSINDVEIKQVDNFKYLGGWLKSTESDIDIRLARAWSVCHRLNKIWKSTMKKELKIHVFLSTVESVLLYNASTWTLTKQLSRRIDGSYTKMLRMALNVHWVQHMTNAELYGNLPRVSFKIAEQRLRISGHCVRHPEELASELILWEPTQGTRSRGRQRTTFIDCIKFDTGLDDTKDIKTAMEDQKLWRSFVKIARSGDRPK